MTTDLENLQPSQVTPVEHKTATDGTVAKEPSVCAKTKKKKIKLKKKSTKGNENFKEGFQQGSYQQSLEDLARGILIGFLLCFICFLVLFLGFFLASYAVRKHNNVPETSEDRKNFAFFVRELRFKLAKVEKIAKRKVPYIISIYSHPYSWTTKDAPLLDDIRNYVNFFNVETDNFYGPWHENITMTGPISPLYSLGNDNRSIDWTMGSYTCKTMKPSQLNVILSFGGAHWRNVSDGVTQADDIHFNVTGRNCSGYYFRWRDLKANSFWNLTKTSWHDVAKTPYIWSPDNQSFITFENERSLEEKMEYILSKNLGGVTLAAIDEDDDTNTLLNAVTAMNMCSGPKFAVDKMKYNCGST
ncbi:hypothetical protein CAEBREN_16946 [Caenorhabditis brenneri]|uniref:GH18 domain-containing protein n=1 Tax=Caenorhabditis brenneri TaxID=135651 RepID=G0PJU4_CAEBE|nr:hypothetical protein CAEBREN_16946 [Caenorhabditis brenneri]